MSGQTKEKHFEQNIESSLLEAGGYVPVDVKGWDKSNALFPAHVCAFIERTQPKLWDEMTQLHGENLQSMIIAALVKELKLKGTLHVLRSGFKFYGKTFRLAYFKPSHGLSPDILKLYEQNELGITRQAFSDPNGSKPVDMLISLNGLPIATLELKNQMTGQTYQKAIKQYREDRDPAHPLFQFKARSLVHFAVDTEDVYMTTQLEKGRTHFLPFNRGSNPGDVKCGRGNPPHPSGYKTGYLWEEILQRDSLLDVLGHFMFIEKREEKISDGKGGSKVIRKERMIFPRYHQIDAVRELVKTSRSEGPGHNYLIQHSAGSGKTNSISWLAHRLSSLHDDDDGKVFDCVIVITDRQVLDSQLQEAVHQIEHAPGVVQAIDENSKQLAQSLVDGTRIVVTTLQKFPFVMAGLLKTAGAEKADDASDEEKETAQQWKQLIANRKYALIVDEAHSSQTGDSATEMKGVLGSAVENPPDDDDDDSAESAINRVMAARGKQPNISFFAFTATPKGKTLELFGRKPNPEATPVAFHTYSMRQAIEEGFILDVLQNYTTYDTYFKLVKQSEDDPELPKRKGSRALAKFLKLHPANISQRIEVIIEHFRRHVEPLLNGTAKAMVVTSSRLEAVKYKLAFDRYIKEQNYSNIRALVAFSGKVSIPVKDSDYSGPDSSTYTEPQMNLDPVNGEPISEKRLKERFNSSDFQVLLVANKYQTGFDQPKLMAMYVDKRLAGVQAVQTLSRLNRKIPGKSSSDIFVLDFVNKPDDILKAFKPYFDATFLQESADIDRLEALKHELDEHRLYEWSEVEAFANVFYKLPGQQRSRDHSQLNRWVTPCKDRFNALSDDADEKWEFRDKLKSFVQLYAFLSQIMPYPDAELEKLYSFGKLTLNFLPTGRDESGVSVGDKLELEYYRLARVHAGAIDLYDGDDPGVKGPTDVGTGNAQEDDLPLSQLIQLLNEKFGTEFNEEDRFFAKQFCEKAASDDKVRQMALANSFDKFLLGITPLITRFMIEAMGENDKFVTKYMDEPDFNSAALPPLAKSIYESVHQSTQAG